MAATRIELLDHGYIELLERGTWGDDEFIIESARMSTDKGFLGWGPKPCPHVAVQRNIDLELVELIWCKECNGTNEVPGDEKLLSHLRLEKHSTPFEFGGATFEIQAPIMVYREWHRHRTQWYSEMSARYVQLPSLFYVPSIERMMGAKQSTTNKQGSASGISEQEATTYRAAIAVSCQDSRTVYEGLLEAGVAREIARLVTPVNQYSRMRAGANLRNWLGFLALRMAPNAQWEIRQYANAAHTLLSQRFPRTLALFDAEMATPSPAACARQFMNGEISAGKFGELLGLKVGELHVFKTAIGAFEE